MFDQANQPEPSEDIISRGYFAQLDNEHIDQILNMQPMKLLSLIKENEPPFVDLIISIFQKMYPQKDISALIDSLLTQHNSREAFALSMQKAFVDGAVICYLLDYVAQKKVHEGGISADTLLKQVGEALVKNSAQDLDGLSEDELRIQREYSGENT